MRQMPDTGETRKFNRGQSRSIMMPSAPEVEKAALSALLNRSPDANRILQTFNPAWFHIPAHRIIFEACRREPGIDLATITRRFLDAEALDDIGGPATLAEIAGYIDYPGQVDRYIETLRKKHVARQAVLASHTLGLATEDPDSDLVEVASRELHRIVAASREGQRTRTMRDIMADFVDDLETRAGAEDTTSGFTSRLGTLNKLTGGIPNNYIVIGGETSTGKSSLLQTFVEDVAITHQKKVLLFSLEMSDLDLAKRMVIAQSGVEADRVFNPRHHPLRQSDIARITKAVDAIAQTDIILRTDPMTTIEQVRAEARDAHAQGNLGLLAVDYLQLANAGDVPKHANREQVVSGISKVLRAINLELRIPVIALTQLNDQGRIRDCRAIGQDAEIYMIIQEDGIEIAKNRNGRRGVTLPVYLREGGFTFEERQG